LIIVLVSLNFIVFLFLSFGNTKDMVIDCWEAKKKYYQIQNCFILPLQWAQLTGTVHTTRLGLEFVFLCCSLRNLYVGLCLCRFCFTLVSWVNSRHFLVLV